MKRLANRLKVSQLTLLIRPLATINVLFAQHPVDKVEQHQRLSAERELYERTKRELNQKLRELKEIHDKENQDASLRFNSIQQQYKILKSSHDDLQQHCEKAKKELATDNDGLRSRLDKVQAQFVKTKSSKENDLTLWKVRFSVKIKCSIKY